MVKNAYMPLRLPSLVTQDQYLSPHVLQSAPATHPRGNHKHFKLRPESIQDKLACRSSHMRTNSYESLKTSQMLEERRAGASRGQEELRPIPETSSSQGRANVPPVPSCRGKVATRHTEACCVSSWTGDLNLARWHPPALSLTRRSNRTSGLPRAGV
eukprot:1186250-Prorocentrum_minimum.AAC.2